MKHKTQQFYTSPYLLLDKYNFEHSGPLGGGLSVEKLCSVCHLCPLLVLLQHLLLHRDTTLRSRSRPRTTASPTARLQPPQRQNRGAANPGKTQEEMNPWMEREDLMERRWRSLSWRSRGLHWWSWAREAAVNLTSRTNAAVTLWSAW